jgi:hypothetical protein
MGLPQRSTPFSVRVRVVVGGASAILVASTALGAAACGGGEAKAPVGSDEGRAEQRKASGREQAVTGYLFASVGERSIGPFFARRGTGPGAAGLAAWVTVAEGSARRVMAVPFDARGVPRGADTPIAQVSVDTTMLVVKPMRGSSPGFIVAWTSLTDRGKSLWSVAIGDDGAPRAKPVELTRTNDDIVWIDVIPTDHGSACIWAEETRGGDANLVAAPLDTDGKVRSAPTRVATGVVGWHALELPTGIGVSTVAAATSDGKSKTSPDARLFRESRPGGALSFHRLDADARAMGAPTVVTTKPIVSGDVEVVRNGSRLLFAWTDRSGDEPAVAATVIDGKTVVEPVRKIVEARGGASLLGLASGSAGLALMFEAPARRKGETRRIHVAKIGPGLVLEPKPMSLEIVGRGQPELAPTSNGFAVLATTPDCEPDAPTCVSANAVATLRRTDAKLAIVQREPLTFLTDPATLGWGLTCEGDLCFNLAASPGDPGTPSRIRTAAVQPRDNTKPAEEKLPAPPKEGPRIVDVTAIVSGESVLDIATTRFGNSSLVAMLSAKGDPKKGDEPGHSREAKTSAATLATRIAFDNGDVSSPNVISTKALPVGGVAVAGAEKPEDGGAMAWVARENGDPEVHVTRIDKRGRRINDIQLTTTKGDASDVTITWAGGGWIVAWVDSRDGNGEVYATKVTPELTRIAREERITNAPGDASDLVALARGDDVWLAWADPRESPKDGIADVFVSAVRMRDAKRAFDERRVLATAAHSRTPHLALGPNGVHLAWIEEAPMGSETPSASGYGAFLTRLDANGAPVDRPTRLPLAGDGAATSVVIEASAAAGLRTVVARSTAEAVSLDAIDLAISPPKAVPLLTLDGPPSLDVALVLEDGILYFNDEGPRPADRRARRARIAWKP